MGFCITPWGDLMRDLVSPLLTQRVVSGLIGLSPQAIRRWETYGVPLSVAGGSSPRRSGLRVYSWRDVEQLQQATYLVENRGVSMAIAGLLLADDGVDRKWIVARPKPRIRDGRTGGDGRPGRDEHKSREEERKSRVVAVRLPLSAKRRPRRAPARRASVRRAPVRRGRRTA